MCGSEYKLLRCTGQQEVTAVILNCKAHSATKLGDCHGSQPVPWWYVDTVALRDKQRQGTLMASGARKR